ncbi:hypothetical protein [Methanosarcina siciliae]|uniref:hypothetical protein n=1 Tax=Methanosarcina siciliae TaxID=38027 RepID=UPI0012E0867D|nr:hypothetical protein [Methanosarcina siciliae]
MALEFLANVTEVVTASFGWVTTTAGLFTSSCLIIPFGLMITRKGMSIAVGALKSMMHG